MAPRCTIREVRSADIPVLLPMMAAYNRCEAIAFRPRRVERALRELLRKRALGLVLIAQDRATGSPIGYGVVTYNYDLEFAGPDAFVTELFVDPERRRSGVAAALLRDFVRRMKRARITALHLLVLPENRGARRLYAKLGFAAVPRVMMTRVLVR
ncbi:MAG TPA: GNAT family N-acetyltransferase [Polyangiales bacterium]|nr:GNAT family N-acetyltransferase [Polyangiales bacterium]